MPEVQIRAINPDNDRELRSLVNLFETSTENIPISVPTNNIAFWQRSIGKRFVSLGAFSDDTLIAHIGIKRSSISETGTELVLPAFSVASNSEMQMLGTACVEVLERLSLRQAWDTLSCVAPLTLSEQSLEFARILGLKESALLPDVSGEAQSFLFRTFSSSTHFSNKPYLSQVNTPELISPFLSTLAADIGLTNLSFTSVNSDSKSERLNIELKRRVRLGQSTIQTHLLEALSQDQAPRHSFVSPKQQFFAVSCENRSDTLLLPSLLSKGFIFCGVLPNFYNSTHILLAQQVTTLPGQTQYVSGSGKSIEDFIKQQTAGKSAKAEIASFPYNEIDSTIDEAVGA